MRMISILMATALLTGGASATAATLHGPKEAAEAVLASEHAFSKRVAEAGVAQGDGRAKGGKVHANSSSSLSSAMPQPPR